MRLDHAQQLYVLDDTYINLETANALRADLREQE